MSNNPVGLVPQTTAFNEASVSERTPVFQYDFSYNINSRLWLQKKNGGTVTIDNNRLKLSTTALANKSARIESLRPIKYRSGQGAIVGFSYIFSTGAAGSKQLAGVGDESNGLFFGYNDDTFGILRRHSGNKHIHNFQVTTPSTTAENITITLNGQTTGNIAVTNSANVTTTANEIAAYADWDLLGDGWEAYAIGDTVVFKSFNAENKSGAYSISASTAAGTFTIEITGVPPVDDWTAKSSWNIDKMDGLGESGITLDTTKGNVYHIQYQWLGFGAMYFYIEDSETGNPVLVNIIKYANQNLTPSFYSPTLPICFLVKNTTNATDIINYTSSCGGFIEGKIKEPDIHHSFDQSMAVNNSTEVPILTILNKDLFAGKVNRNRIKINFIDTNSDTGKIIDFNVYLGSTLTGASFSDVEANNSMVAEDTSATLSENGDRMFANGGGIINLTVNNFYLYPGEILTVTQKGTTGTGNVSAFINWVEDF